MLFLYIKIDTNVSNWLSQVLNSIYSSHILILFRILSCILSWCNIMIMSMKELLTKIYFFVWNILLQWSYIDIVNEEYLMIFYTAQWSDFNSHAISPYNFTIAFGYLLLPWCHICNQQFILYPDLTLKTFQCVYWVVIIPSFNDWSGEIWK